jgi:hypothetical protein
MDEYDTHTDQETMRVLYTFLETSELYNLHNITQSAMSKVIHPCQ